MWVVSLDKERYTAISSAIRFTLTQTDYRITGLFGRNLFKALH